MTEQLLVAVWRAPGVTLETCRTRIVDEWVPEAINSEGLIELTVSFAVDDQGPYAKEPDSHGMVPTVDALCSIGLERAHDLDDIPARDALHPFSRRVEAWRVDTREPKRWERTWPDGEPAPGLKMVSFMRRAEGLTRQQFLRHWSERHTPLALEHHVGLWNYRQNMVRRAYTPGGGQIDGIAELHFRTREDFEDRFFDSDAGRKVILDDVKRFMAPPGPETALMTELPLRTAG
ncbi:MAG: hypothetical protein JWL83_1637 [Actinomycetia bacterium]|nr:hypothetical protein [Actinomycetes bacterium]